MKQITKFLIIAAVMLSFTAATFAQTNTAQATATATIVTPITIVRVNNMSFGNVIQTVPANPSTVIISPVTGLAAYTNATASATPAATAGISPATYTVSGTPGAAYSITLPGTVTLTGPTSTMTADNFTSNPATPGALSSPGGTQALSVGAQLNLVANQAAGTYTSGNFDVTVNYN
jgi:hypothetical protein